MKISSIDQLSGCSPMVRAQLEKALVQTGTLLRDAPGSSPVETPAFTGLKRRNAQPEQEAGAKLVEWIDLLVLPNGLRPGLFFAHVANAGVAGGKVRGGILQGQGVRAGWPDYILDLPLGPYHGFRLELKAEEGAKPTEEQLATLARLEGVGYKCAVAWGFDDAKQHVERYLDLAAVAPTAAPSGRR